MNELIARKNKEIGRRIADRRIQLGMSQDELAAKVGYTSESKRTIVQKIEAGKIGVGQSKIDLFADALQITRNQLMGWEDDAPTITNDYVNFPIIGEVAAGYEHFADEDSFGNIDIPASWLHGRKASDYFVLRVAGDSMYPMYQDGDLVLVLKQATMNHSGQVGVFIYDDDKATLKRIEYIMGEDWVRLVPINPQYPPQMIRDEALEHCRVLGIPKRLIRDIIQ